MPVIKTEIDVSCWCGNCGKGICHKAGVRGLDITIDPCDCQINRIDELERIQSDLEDQIEELVKEIKQLQD